MNILAWFRHRRATKLRRQLKLTFFREEMKLWRSGKTTALESLDRRNDFYAKVDAMTDEDVLAL